MPQRHSLDTPPRPALAAIAAGRALPMLLGGIPQTGHWTRSAAFRAAAHQRCGTKLPSAVPEAMMASGAPCLSNREREGRVSWAGNLAAVRSGRSQFAPFYSQ